MLLLVLIFCFCFFFIHYINGVVIHGMVIRSVVYGHRVILVGPYGAFMSSTSAVHAVRSLPHILNITDVAGHYIYNFIRFAVKVASYWV